MSANNEVIGRQAIGRHEFIGGLYDIRSDRFDGRNLFNRELPPSYVSTTDCAYTTYIVDENESQRDTFNKLNIDAAMKVSLMAGLLNVEGSAKYLNQTKTDSRTVRVTHILQLKTKKQHLHISMADLCKYFSSDALENSNATHCVIGITWGANIAATFEETLATSEAAEEIQGQLSAYLKKPLTSISGDAKLVNADQTNSKFRSLKISFSGDVLIKDVPHTVEDVFNIFRKVPFELEKLNDSKGQQLEFELYPLKRIAEIFKYELCINRIIREVSIHLLNRFEDVFEQIIQGKRIINDFLDSVKPWKDWIPSNWIEVIIAKQTKLKTTQTDTQVKLAAILEQIRRGEADEQKMVDFLDNFDQNNECSVRSIRQFVEENSKNKTKIDSLNEIRQYLEDIEGENKQSKGRDLSLLFPKDTSIHDFINRNHDHDVYLLHISNEWKKNDVENWYKQIRFFSNLYKSQPQNETKKTVFRLIDHDLLDNLDDKPNRCVIYHAYLGKIDEGKDYYHTSRITLSEDQIRTIRAENKLTTITNSDIVKRHKEFIAAHPTGEMNKEEFAAEFQRLFPLGESRCYCNYAFKTLDKNKSVTISFDEFMSAIALTLPGDIEHQLALTFQMCAYNDQEQISIEELVQFLEAVAELKGEDSKSASLIAKTIVKFDKRRQDEKITKEEFISHLKGNYDLCVAFLPIEVSITHKSREGAGNSNQKPDILCSKNEICFHGGNLLTVEQQQKLNEFYGKDDAQWQLIYKAKRDGFAGKDFHRQCDDKGPTMTIIKSKSGGYLFGGYTVPPWSSDNGRRTDSTAFLFTLTNPRGQAMTKFNIGQHLSATNKKFSAYHYNHGGPIFGGVTLGLWSGGLALGFSAYGLYGAAANCLSADICVQNNCDVTPSTIDFPQAFIDTSGHGQATFTGAREFLCDDIETYELN
ncbi:unnamed protein product [Rotaria socialis]|uniref:TLDc domain-containing protein n=1 Tax=Rotaria socialis TaxID=392032 RepID=A0A818SDY2_9BILA|nr:unnamed protein product [Rotaria socialis]CAF3669933.1 unnamed protein product [Rotaria socialis]